MLLALGWKAWTRNDFVYGILLPLIVVLIIVGLSQLRQIFGFGSLGIVTGIVMEIEEIVVVGGIPLLFGLIWNRWAGGVSGFLLGSLYALSVADKFGRLPTTHFTGTGTLLLGYVVSAMLIGYMAGVLNKRSDNFSRMLIVGVLSTTIGGVLLFGVLQLSPVNVVTGLDGFLLTVLSRTACGAIVPVIAKVFTLYGVTMGQKNQQ